MLKGSSDVTIERNTGLQRGYVLFAMGYRLIDDSLSRIISHRITNTVSLGMMWVSGLLRWTRTFPTPS